MLDSRCTHSESKIINDFPRLSTEVQTKHPLDFDYGSKSAASKSLG